MEAQGMQEEKHIAIYPRRSQVLKWLILLVAFDSFCRSSPSSICRISFDLFALFVLDEFHCSPQCGLTAGDPLINRWLSRPFDEKHPFLHARISV
jgi:hypothetical protein